MDNVHIHGNAFVILREAMTFMRRHLPVAGRIQAGLFEREDEPLFPLEALREALVNAICHRDYALPGGAISLAIFDDRLEIWSDGTLPSGIRVADLKRDHQSRPRNPLIASVLYQRGLVESWGRGTHRIVALCALAGHPQPDFLELARRRGRTDLARADPVRRAAPATKALVVLRSAIRLTKGSMNPSRRSRKFGWCSPRSPGCVPPFCV